MRTRVLPSIAEWEVRGKARRGIWERLTPPQLFIASFALLILGGTVGLKVLPNLYTGEPLSWLDALFTSTSAVCVTGLIVVDTATYFTFWGQLWILVLVQLGGLGIITFTTFIILALGRRLSLRHEALAGAEIELGEELDRKRLAYDILRFAFALEAAGALILYVLWVPHFGITTAAWHAVFQSISAFCNAGFSTFSDSLMGFQTSAIALLTITTLIVAGGIGFLVLEELYLRRRSWRDPRGMRLSLHTRLAIVTTGLLLALGTALYLMFEWNGVLSHMNVADRVSNALFMSATARTAGFNSINYAAAGDDTNFLTILLMSIGGSPGSTAGGIKTTTFALIGLLAFARLRGDQMVSIWGRSVPEETIQRAVGLFVLAFAVVTFAIFGYAHTELRGAAHGGGPFLAHMFEAVSAFNTVGLSLGATPHLSSSGRFLTVLLMFVGRVGPLVFAAALARRASRGARVRFSYEDVVIG